MLTPGAGYAVWSRELGVMIVLRSGCLGRLAISSNSKTCPYMFIRYFTNNVHIRIFPIPRTKEHV